MALFLLLPANMLRPIFAFLVLPCLGCIGGFDIDSQNPTNNTQPNNPPPPVQNETFSLTATLDASTITLDDVAIIDVEVESISGFSGNVSIQATGVPAGWGVEVADPVLSVTASQLASTSIALTPPPTAGNTTQDFAVTASDGASSLDAPAQPLQVINEYVIPMAGHDYPSNLTLPAGTTIRFLNNDGQSHQVHADNIGGFNHQNDPLPPGQSYSVTPTISANYAYYCHIHGSGSGESTVTITN